MVAVAVRSGRGAYARREVERKSRANLLVFKDMNQFCVIDELPFGKYWDD